MLYSKGQMNAAKQAGMSVEQYASKSNVVIDVKENEISRDEIKAKLDAKGIEFKKNASTESLKKLLGE